MAHESEKKRAKAAAATKTLYTQITVALYILWFVIRVLWRFSDLSFSTGFGFCCFSALNYLCMSAVIKASEYGTPYESWQDVLFVNWAVQFLSMFTSYAFYLYLVIPLYAAYMYGGYTLRMLGFGSSSASPSIPGMEPTETHRRKREKQPTR